MEKSDERITHIEVLVGSKIVFCKEIGPGVNSRIYKVTTANGKTYCVKLYMKRAGDTRDRLGTEFQAFARLWQYGIRVIPKPIAYNQGKSIGVYAFIPGKTFRAKPVSDDHILQAITLLTHLHRVRTSKRLPQFFPASEACFSINDLVKNIQVRKNKLMKISVQHEVLYQFLTRDWEPAWSSVLGYIKQKTKSNLISPSTPLPVTYRTLSPSDFGFHNAILGTHGNVTFIDFEYFGWDDPAKLIADFLLHPGMKLTKEQKSFFVKKAAGIYKNDPTLANRFAVMYPLLGLKWSLIMLNCFLDTSKSSWRWRNVASVQLKKAKKNLDSVHNAFIRHSLPTISP